MRISISGSFSTGKTTLARALFDRLLTERGRAEVCFIEETARKVIASGFKLDRSGTLEAYLTYVQIQLEAERAATAPIVISDRSLADLLAYVRTNGDPLIPQSFELMLEEILRLDSKRFDLYCYVPIEFALVVDDVRSADEPYQRVVDANLRRVLVDFELPYMEVGGTLGERITQVLERVPTGAA